MLETPEITQTSPRISASIHLTIPRAEMPKVFGPTVGELMAALAAQGVEPSGPVFTHHLKMAPDIFDFELSVPVSKPVAAAGRVKPTVWPAMKVARTVYQGPYEGLPEAWREFMGWIKTEGLTPAADLWECYITHPDSNPDPASWRTELNRPLVD